MINLNITLAFFREKVEMLKRTEASQVWFSMALQLDIARHTHFGTLAFFREKVEMLKRTEASQVWFSMALQLDIARHTHFGTLGYLPPEVRQHVWEYLFEPFKAHEADGEIEIGTLEHGFYPEFQYSIFEPHCFYAWLWRGSPYLTDLYNLRAASADIQLEIDHSYLSTRIFHFPDAACLTIYLGFLGEQASSLRRISIALPRTFDTHERDLVDVSANKAWIDAFAHLPPELSSVTFRLSILDTRFYRLWEKWKPPGWIPRMTAGAPNPVILFNERPKAFARRLWTLDVLNKRVIRIAPNAVTAIGGDGGFEFFSRKEQADMESVLMDVER